MSERLARFAKLHPDNAWANYYYAVGLWKQRKGPEDSETPARVRNCWRRPSVSIRVWAPLTCNWAFSIPTGTTTPKRYRRLPEGDRSQSPGWMSRITAWARLTNGPGKRRKPGKNSKLMSSYPKKLRQEIERERSEIQQFVIELRAHHHRVRASGDGCAAMVPKPASWYIFSSSR
jgi:hypothetical protein